MTKEAV